MDFSLYFNSNAKQNVLPKLLAVAIPIHCTESFSNHFPYQLSRGFKKFIVFLFHLILPRGVFAPGPNDPPGPSITESSVINTLPPPVAHTRPQTGIKLRESCQAPLLLHRKNQRQQISEGVIFPAIDVDIYRSIGGLGRWLQRLIVGMVGPVPA